MKKRVFSALLCVSLIISALFAGCGGQSNNAQTKGKISFTDMNGSEINLNEPAKKIVVLTAGDCEILYAIGAGDLIVGRGEYCNYPEEASKVKAVASGSETNIEQIIALEPNVVIMSKMDQTNEQVEALKKAGITTVMTNGRTIEDTYKCIEICGKVCGKDSEATKLVSDMKKDFEEIKKSVPEDKKGKTIYFEVSPLEYGLWAAGSGSFMDEIANMLGLKNIFSDISSWAEVSEEQVLQRNPELIVTSTMYYGTGLKPSEEILTRKAWQNVDAIKNKAIYNVDSDSISRPGPRLVEAAKSLKEFAYGK